MNADPSDMKELHLWTVDGGVADPLRLKLLDTFIRTLRPGDSVLDIGCGQAFTVQTLHERGVKVLGIDLNVEMVSDAQARGLPVRLGDAREVLSDGVASEFSVLSMLDFIEHVPLDLFIDLLRLARQKPGRAVWIQTPNLDSLMGFKFWFHMPSHTTAIHPWVLRQILSRNGFEIVSEWTDWGGIPWGGVRRWITTKILNALFGAPLAKLFVGGGNICIIARAGSANPT